MASAEQLLNLFLLLYTSPADTKEAGGTSH